MLKLLLLFAFILSSQNGCEQSNAKKNEQKTDTLSENIHLIITPTPPPIEEKRQVSNEKEQIAERLEKNDPDGAALVRSPETRLSELPAPFLRSGRIYRAEKFTPTRPVIIYVGIDDKDYAVILNANETGLIELGRRAGLILDSQDLRLSYARIFITAILAKNKRLVVIENIDEIKPRPNLTEEQKGEFAAFREKYEKEIAPPRCAEGMCSFFVIKGQDLARLELDISHDGSTKVSESILEKDILIPYAQ